MGNPFMPVVDNFTQVDHSEFFPKDPWDILQEGSFNLDVPMILGTNQFEGLMNMAEYINAEDSGQGLLKQIFNDPENEIINIINMRYIYKDADMICVLTHAHLPNLFGLNLQAG